MPVLDLKTSGKMNFVIYQPERKLHLNKYRILEPEYTDIFPVAQLDLVILPLVGFDMRGNRLGVGGGYYDRSFAFKLQNMENPPLLYGLAYDFQRQQTIPKDEWDVPLNGVITEKNIYTF